jgi:hypothetical protein
MSVNAVPDPPPDRTSTEPAMKVGGITSAVTAVTAIIGVLVAFGVGVTAEQSAALVAAVVALAAAGPLVSGWFTRSRVYAPATVAKMLDANTAEARADATADSAARERWPGPPSHRLEP